MYTYAFAYYLKKNNHTYIFEVKEYPLPSSPPIFLLPLLPH